MNYKKVTLVMCVGFIFGSAHCMEDWYSAIKAVDPSFNFSDGEYDILPQKSVVFGDFCAHVTSTLDMPDEKDAPDEKNVTQQKLQEYPLTRSKRKLTDSDKNFYCLPTVLPVKKKYKGAHFLECPSCNLEFDCLRNMRNHSCRQKNISGGVMCFHCNKFYPTLDLLNNHALARHGQQEKVYKKALELIAKYFA